MIHFNGHSDGKVIVPDDAVELPSGRPLRVTVEELDDPARPHSSRQVLLRLAREAEAITADLPEDLSTQHDHYLYGTDKR